MYCRFCKIELPNDASYCQKCGKSLEGQIEPDTRRASVNTPEARRLHSLLFGNLKIISLIIVIGLLGGGLAFYKYSQSDPTSSKDKTVIGKPLNATNNSTNNTQNTTVPKKEATLSDTNRPDGKYDSSSSSENKQFSDTNQKYKIINKTDMAVTCDLFSTTDKMILPGLILPKSWSLNVVALTSSSPAKRTFPSIDYYKGQGISIGIYHYKSRNLTIVGSYLLEDPTYQTVKGIKVGQTDEDLFRKYGLTGTYKPGTYVYLSENREVTMNVIVDKQTHRITSISAWLYDPTEK